MNTQRTETSKKVAFDIGDYVVYRDADRYWAGKDGHTVVCRVTNTWSNGLYDLTVLGTGDIIYYARPAYMRLLPAADAMHDIDTAALDDPSVLSAAAVAWLRTQQATQASPPPGRLELPRGR